MERRGATRFGAQRKKWYLSQAHREKSGSILLQDCYQFRGQSMNIFPVLNGNGSRHSDDAHLFAAQTPLGVMPHSTPTPE